jgi:hypothetical protein
MASSTTQAIATRLPNELADYLRCEADRYGITMAAVTRQCIRQAVDDESLRIVIRSHRQPVDPSIHARDR